MCMPHNTKEIRHAYKSKYILERENQVILLMITDGKKWHYQKSIQLTNSVKKESYCKNISQFVNGYLLLFTYTASIFDCENWRKRSSKQWLSFSILMRCQTNLDQRFYKMKYHFFDNSWRYLIFSMF